MKLTLLSMSLLALGSLEAAPITGSLWAIADSVAQNAVFANVPATAPDITFQVNSPINFNIGGPASIGTFLATGGAFNITGTASQLNRFLSDGVTGSIIEFTGLVSVTTGQQFTVTHDDGLTLNIGGLNVISVPGPTGPTQTTSTYTGPSGNLPFTLIYGECCGGSAVLQLGLPLQPQPPPPPGMPEPATFATVAVAGLILIARRFL